MKIPVYIPGIPTSITAECPHCGHSHSCRVERDEDGFYAEDIETTRCNHDECTVKLCSECPQFVCELCGLSHCAEHAIDWSGGGICPVCAESLKAEGAVELSEASDG